MDLRRWLRAEWDRVAGFGLVGAGAVVLVVGYDGVRTSAYVAQQISYAVSGGLGGLFLLGLGVGLLISADLHDEWRKLDRIEAVLRGESPGDPKGLLELLRHANGTKPEPESTPSPAPVGAARGRAREVMAAVGVEPSAGPAVAPGGVVALDWKASGLRRGFGAAALGAVLAAVVLFAGWWRSARTADLGGAWEGAALGGLGVVVAVAVIGGHGFWLRQRLAARIRRMFGAAEFGAAASRPQPAGPDGAVVVAGLRRFHRAGCPALATVTSPAATVARGDVDPNLEPCRICGAT